MDSSQEYPQYIANFYLSTNKVVQERQAYTFMELLGDFGGFNDALFFIIGALMSLYSSRMYLASIATELPLPSICQESASAIKFYGLRSKLLRQQNASEIVLDSEDVSILQKALRLTV